MTCFVHILETWATLTYAVKAMCVYFGNMNIE